MRPGTDFFAWQLEMKVTEPPSFMSFTASCTQKNGARTFAFMSAS